jgi:WASH complex subunit strumpellin
MLRMFQAESPDIESVSKFYSNELVKIVKEVLQIVPHLVFQKLGRLIEIFIFEMEKEPQKVDKNHLEKYAQFELRLEIAKYTNEISVLAESILNMESYLLGVVEINPRELLEAEIRK